MFEVEGFNLKHFSCCLIKMEIQLFRRSITALRFARSNAGQSLGNPRLALQESLQDSAGQLHSPFLIYLMQANLRSALKRK